MGRQKAEFSSKMYCLFGLGNCDLKSGDYVLCVKDCKAPEPWFISGKIYEVRLHKDILRLQCEKRINASANHGAKFAPLSPAMKILWGIK